MPFDRQSYKLVTKMAHKQSVVVMQIAFFFEAESEMKGRSEKGRDWIELGEEIKLQKGNQTLKRLKFQKRSQ